MRRILWLVLLLVPATVTGVAAMKRASNDGAVVVHEARIAAIPRRGDADTDYESRITNRESDIRYPASGIGNPMDKAGGIPEELARYSKAGKTVRFGALDWKAGTTWTVESHYRQMQADGDWSDVILWKYRVRGIEKFDGVDAFVVDVEPQGDLPYNPGGTMYVAAADHAVLAVRDRLLERGQIRERLVRFDDAAVSVLFPTELPPRDAEARERSGATPLPTSPFARGPKVETPAAAHALDVSFEAGGTTIRQRWDAANRVWPLVSSSPARISYLKP
jgi:hypothetical protein